MTYDVYYDRGTRCWWAFWRDAAGNQISEAVNDHSKEWCLIYLGMSRPNQPRKEQA